MDPPHNIQSLLKIHINNIFKKEKKKNYKKVLKKTKLGEELQSVPPREATIVITNGKMPCGGERREVYPRAIHCGCSYVDLFLVGIKIYTQCSEK